MYNLLITHRKTFGLCLGVTLFITILLLPVPASMQTQAMGVLAVTALMASWWITEAIPIPATALVPIVLFPALGVMPASQVTLPYANHLIYLFLGGFLIAVTIERWNLHRRIALHTIQLVGVTPNRIILAFMLATAALSMWISNTAAAMMMLTIGLAVLKQIGARVDALPEPSTDVSSDQCRFGTSLMLGIGYAASLGGIATLIGTPPNAILAGVIEGQFGIEINFLNWLLFALPLALIMLFITWVYLTRIAFPCGIGGLPGGREMIRRQLIDLGPISRQERMVLAVFITVALLWMGRGLIGAERLPNIKDSTIAMGGALLLFILPANIKAGEFLLDWRTAVKIPWDILILFGGGFALAQGFSDSGLTHAIATQLRVLQGSHILLVIAAITTVVIFLTEITSNTATASLFLPVMGALAIAMQVHPLGLMIAATIAASFAFMLPVATPPNAIIFSSRYVTIQQMAKTGIWLNFIGIILISLFITLILPRVWGVDITHLPMEIIKR